MERFELPAGWEWRSLGDPEVAEINPKKSAIRHLADDLPVTFIPMEAVSDESGAITTPGQRFLGEVRKGYTYFSEGDVIFAKITPCMENGKSAIARELINSVGFGSTEFHVFRPGPKMTAKWLHCLLRSKQLRDEAKVAMTGAAGQQRVPRNFLTAYEIPIPPLSEQNRLIARIEAFARRIEESRKMQREAISEAEKIFAAAVNEALEADREEWPECSLGSVLELVQYGTSAKAHVEMHGVPVLRMGNIQRGRVLANNLKFLELPSNELARYQLIPGDILINRTNSAELVGKAGLFDLKSEFVFASYLIRLRVEPDVADPAFINYVINSESGQAYLKTQGKDAIGQTNINSRQIKNLPLRLPPLDQQWRIARRLDAIRNKADELLAVQRSADADLRTIIPAILAKAFRGEL